MNDVIARKLAEIESAKVKIEAAKAEIEFAEKGIEEILKAEGWNYHNNIADYGYGQYWGWAGWLHPSVVLDPHEASPPEDESLMYLYKYASCSFEIK